MLGAFFCATDTVTSPMTGMGALIFGAGCGVCHLPYQNMGRVSRGSQLRDTLYERPRASDRPRLQNNPVREAQKNSGSQPCQLKLNENSLVLGVFLLRSRRALRRHSGRRREFDRKAYRGNEGGTALIRPLKQYSPSLTTNPPRRL